MRWTGTRHTKQHEDGEHFYFSSNIIRPEADLMNTVINVFFLQNVVNFLTGLVRIVLSSILLHKVKKKCFPAIKISDIVRHSAIGLKCALTSPKSALSL
jgi:hypothetical protein